MKPWQICGPSLINVFSSCFQFSPVSSIVMVTIMCFTIRSDMFGYDRRTCQSQHCTRLGLCHLWPVVSDPTNSIAMNRYESNVGVD